VSASERPAPATGTGPSENRTAAKPSTLAAQCMATGDSSAPATLANLGRLLRDEGAARANGSMDRWWRSCATAGLLHLAALGQPFTADRLRDLGVPEPTHPNYVGALFIGASKAGVIRPVGFTTSRRPSRHAGVQRVWVGGDGR
jgi:hypothetical protein